MLRSAVVALVALVALTLSGHVDATSARTTQVTQVSTPRLELVGQSFAFEPDGLIQLSYRLVGIADDALELAPRPATVEPAVEAPVDTSAVTSEPTVPVLPDPIALTIEVTNYQPLTTSTDVDELVGSDVDPDAFTGAIDGVVITDLRERATVGDDGSVEFTLEIQTDVVDSIEQRLKFERPGLYPLRVQLLTGDPRDDNIVATAGTIVQRLPGATEAQAPPIDLSVVAVTPSPSPRATAAESTAARTALDDAVDLASTLDAPVTLEVPPTLVAEVAATPAGAERLAAALEGDELVALPVLPLDVSSAVAAGRAETYTRLVVAGEELLTAAVPTTATVRTVWIDDRRAQCRRCPTVARSRRPLRGDAGRAVPRHGESATSRHRSLRRSRTSRRRDTAHADRRRPLARPHTSGRRRHPGHGDGHRMVGADRSDDPHRPRRGRHGTHRPARPTQPDPHDTRPRHTGRPSPGRTRGPRRDHPVVALRRPRRRSSG